MPSVKLSYCVAENGNNSQGAKSAATALFPTKQTGSAMEMFMIDPTVVTGAQRSDEACKLSICAKQRHLIER